MNQKYTAAELINEIDTIHELYCSKCGRGDEIHYCDDIDAADQFFNDGWRSTGKNIYCPPCAEKYLKSSQTKKK